MISGQVTTAAASLARERSLPIHPALVPLFGSSPETPGSMVGLIRGHTVVCTGTAAMSCALALAAAPTQAGSWVGIMGVPQIGVAAAQHLGVVLERTIFVDPPDTTASGARPDLVGALSALVDGVDMVLMGRRVVTALSTAILRRVQTRAQARGAVLVIVGDPGSVTADLRMSTRTQHWEGIGTGHGHLRRRLVALELDGRRCGRPRRHPVWLPNDRGELAAVGDADVPIGDRTDESETSSVVVPLRRTG